VTLSGAAPTRCDIPVVSAISDLRIALLSHELVESALLTLADKRHAFDSAQPEGENYWACVGLTAQTLQVFSESEIDYFASIIRERRRLGVWGLSAPVGGAGGLYGRQGRRARSVAPCTVELAAKALARRLDAARRGSRETDLDLADELGYAWSNVRQAIHRTVKLAAVPVFA
jgi:hypothetical protein